MSHTPGPWTVEESPNYQGIPGLYGATICGSGHGVLIAEIRGAVQIDGTRHTENGANAKLLAAAPEMLAALQLILNSDMAMREEDEGNVSPMLDLVRAVIALATP